MQLNCAFDVYKCKLHVFNDMAHLSHVMRKPVFGVSLQVQLKPGCRATKDGSRFKMYCFEAKIKVLISCTVTVQLICAFVFAYVKGRFSHKVAHFLSEPQPILFEVRCDDHNVQIGGYPWHYIITPHGTMGFFSVHNLKDHKLVRDPPSRL